MRVSAKGLPSPLKRVEDGDEKKKKVKILFFDIETSPNIVYTWGYYEQNVIKVIKERKIISVAWKWYGNKTVHSMCIPDFYGYNNCIKNNERLIRKLHSLFCSADVLVGQNSDNFDIKMANSEFVQYGLTPPPPHKTIDTLKVARSKFRFNSNKLNDIGIRLGLGEKIKTGGFELWENCMAGKKDAWALMVKYNKQDVVLLEKVYLKFRGWVKNHPNMNAFDLRPVCTTCKSNNILKRGWFFSKIGRRHRYQCYDCGNWMVGQLIKAKHEKMPS